MAIATFAAGCFWGVEESFRVLPGVLSTEVGYTGGQISGPTYEQVCSGRTGHAEAVRIDYDPSVISYEELLAVLWDIHDPTTPNRQGPDIGTQYRSAIFTHSPQQADAAHASIARLAASGAFLGPIVTQVVPASEWWTAEGYHQQYLLKRGEAVCH